jgi:pimeloyl-ACP methyl ester carboxylesterase
MKTLRMHCLLLASAFVLLTTACDQQQQAAPSTVAAIPAIKKASLPPHAMPREATTASLARDHSTIRYRVYGKGVPALVLIHGWSCDSGYWDSQLDALAAAHTVITLDLAGHGKSDARRRSDWSIENFGADVAAVVGATGERQVILVGHSMGGAVALAAARLLPGKVAGIVGVDTWRDIAHPFPKEMTAPVLQGMRKDFVAATTALADENFFTAQSDPIVRRWIVKDMAAAPPAVAIPAMEHLLTYDYRPVLAELDLPLVAINAAGTPTDEAAIRALEPRFRVVTMPGVGHFLMMEKPALFNRMLLQIAAAWHGRPAPPTTPLPATAPTR